MKVGLIGYGVVGKAAENTFQKEYDIVKYDKYQDLDDFKSLLYCDFVFIMVPTPFDCKKNAVDQSAITESLEKLAAFQYKNIVIIKSTVPPGSCINYVGKYDLDIVYNPEFLRESTTPNEDFENQHTIVIGTDTKQTFEKVKNLYHKVSVSNAHYYHVSATDAEMIKCSQNTMLASRVALANMVYDACIKHNVDYELVKKIAFERFDILGPYMVQVPGPDGKRGYGGKCLPKDTMAFSTINDSELLLKIIEYNNSLRDDLDKFLMNYK